MKKAGLMGIIVLLVGIITFYLLWHQPAVRENVVKYKGPVALINFSKGYLDWVSGSGFPDTVGAIPAQKNDLIGFMVDNDDEDYFFLIRSKALMHQPVNFTYDSLGLYVDGKLASLLIHNNEKAFLRWMRSAKKEDMRHLQSVILSDSISNQVLQGIEKIGQSAPGIGLYINENSDHGFEVLQYLHPSWLWINTDLDSLILNQLYQSKNLESLVLSVGDNHQTALSRFTGLKSLQLIDPDSLNLIQLSQLPKNITSLQVVSSRLKDLSFVENLSQLEELTINHCSSLKDISSLKMLPHLKVLSLADCEAIQDLNPLSALKELTWLCLPANTTEEELAAVVDNSPQIETIIFSNCEKIKSIQPIKHLKKLTYLAVLGTPIEADSLARLQQLKYLAYGNDVDDKALHAKDSLTILTLKKAMPHTLVTPAEPFCLSTGWLIVFIALLILFTLMAVKVKNKVSA